MQNGFLKWVFIVTLVVCASMFWISQGVVESKDAESQPGKSAESECLSSVFTQSLHFTGEGMRYWYEEEGGFMDITGIPYDQLDCKTCHVRSCDKCHARESGGRSYFSEHKTKSMNTCLPCHSREKLTFKFDGEKGHMDVHTGAGMVCADCHHNTDVHGDGKFRDSMRSPGAVQADCEKCHIDQCQPSPAFDTSIESHQVHNGKLDCSACHVSNTMACLNCHFDNFLDTGKRAGNFVPIKDWTLLINHEGKVTAGSAMTLVYKNQKFLAYVPYYTHSIEAKGRQCEACHMNEAVRTIMDGNAVEMLAYENGELKHWQGAVPVRPESLNWVFLNKTRDGGWEPVPNDDDPKIQFAAYGKPLTEEQFNKLSMDFSR